MLIDDSIVVRSIIERILLTDGRFSVVASCSGAQEALDYLAGGDADVALLDLNMPGMSGVEAIPRLIELAPQMRVLILSANCTAGGAAAMAALAGGAHETLLKPGGGTTFAGAFAQILTQRILALKAAPVVPAPLSMPQRSAVAADIGAIDAIAIGGSTGGIAALHQLLAELPAMTGCPIFVTQHLPAGFIPFFAEQLERATGRTTRVAADALRVEPDVIHVAAGEAHLGLIRSPSGVRIVNQRGAAPSGIVPSVDPMFEHLAEVYGERAVGVVLSGMGRDGARGAAHVRRAGGHILAQDIATSVVWGMPGAVVGEGSATLVLPPAAIGRAIGEALAQTREVAA